MKFSERMVSFFDDCREKLRRRADIRAQRKRRLRRLMNEKYIRTEGSNIWLMAPCVGGVVLLMLLGIICLIFPDVLFVIFAALTNSVLLRVLLILVLMPLALIWLCALWCLIDILHNASVRRYESGFFETQPRDIEDDFDSFMYEPDEYEPDEESYYEGYSPTDSPDDEEYGEYERYSRYDSDDALFEEMFGRRAQGDFGEEKSEDNSEAAPEKESSREEQPDGDAETCSEPDVYVQVFEREVEGQGRVTLKYAGSYIKGLIRSAVSRFADRLYIKELNVNFLREAFEVEIIADAAAGAGHAAMIDELYAAVRAQLGEIACSSRIDLSLVVQDVREAGNADGQRAE